MTLNQKITAARTRCPDHKKPELENLVERLSGKTLVRVFEEWNGINTDALFDLLKWEIGNIRRRT